MKHIGGREGGNPWLPNMHGDYRSCNTKRDL
jgi:hypothetical protein